MSFTTVNNNRKPELTAPAYRITIDGKDISARIKPRLMSLDIEDNRGFEADTVSIKLDDADGQLAMPRKGATMQVWLGWQGEPLVNKGTYTIDELEHSGAPDVLSIRGKAADLRGSLNKQREQSYHEQTLSDILAILAERNQLTLAVEPNWGHEQLPHLDQQNESDAAFLSRLAKDYDAIATVKQGKLLFIKAGKSETASGAPLPNCTIVRQIGDSHRFSIADRNAYSGVVAMWQDPKKAKKQAATVKRKNKPKEPTPSDVTIDSNELRIGDDENVKTLRHVYASKRNAERAARAAWDKLQRGVAQFSINLAKGRPELFPEIPVTVTGFKPQIDQAQWVLTRVTHNITDSGYTNSLELEVKNDEVPE
ncbi:phage late control D family protein [Motilimonas sp. 1_MG-2023]|uniref:phage late control D family protein n=1 Tax=Motilimonas sp. 1_MG-2023 TaxID=3062672 RepID=UPI0026E35B8C|nr:phage late control D family protein [Motilimonas sp. 1_MG-2023]MDO6525426.1 phage late control D family protein [Motilimonas sp. 1_MG-2023]